MCAGLFWPTERVQAFTQILLIGVLAFYKPLTFTETCHNIPFVPLDGIILVLPSLFGLSCILFLFLMGCTFLDRLHKPSLPRRHEASSSPEIATQPPLCRVSFSHKWLCQIASQFVVSATSCSRKSILGCLARCRSCQESWNVPMVNSVATRTRPACLLLPLCMS